MTDMRFIYKIGIYLPFILPLLLIFSRTVADLSVILICILFLIKSFYENNFQWLKKEPMIFISPFVLYLIFFNSPLSINPIDSINYSLGFLRWPIFSFAIAYWLINSKNSIDNFYWGILIAFFIFLTDFLYQYFIDSGGIFNLSGARQPMRLTVPFSANLIPGRFILFYTFILSGLLLISSKINEKLKMINLKITLVILLGAFCVFISGERMVFLIYLSSSFLLGIALTFNQKKINYFYFPIIILSITSILIAGYFLDPNVFDRAVISSILKIKNFFSSDYGEVFITSIDKWKTNFFFGSGLHQFQNAEPIYGFNIFSKGLIHHAHNLPLNLLVETGIIGLTLFYFFIYKLIDYIFKSYKKNNDLTFFILCLILIYICFFPLHTHFKFSHNWINANVWLIVGLILSLNKIYEKNYSHK